MLSWDDGLGAGRLPGFRGEGFELSRGGFRALVGRTLGFYGKFEGKKSSVGEEIRAIVGLRDFVGRIWWGFGLSRGFAERFGRSNRFDESKGKGSLPQMIRFCESNRFYEIGQQGSSIKEGVVLGADLCWRTLNPKFRVLAGKDKAFAGRTLECGLPGMLRNVQSKINGELGAWLGRGLCALFAFQLCFSAPCYQPSSFSPSPFFSRFPISICTLFV